MRWANNEAQHAPIVAAHWEACSAERCVRGSRRAANVAALSGLSFPVAGDYTARVWLEDAAGNQRSQSAISTVQMRYDPIAPSVTFEPPDPSDPLRVAITASDKHSGVGSGEIEIRRVGTSAWHGIDTKLSSPGLVAYVDDERFRNGVYEFRAHATDRAGNEASIGPKDAGAASLRLPVRATTKLRAGARRIKIKRRVVYRDGRRQTVRKRVAVLDPRLRASFGSQVRLHGRLTNADGQPLESATVEVLDADTRDQAAGHGSDRNRRGVQLPLEGDKEPRHPVPISRFEENRGGRGSRSHPGPGGEHHPGRPLDGAKR